MCVFPLANGTRCEISTVRVPANNAFWFHDPKCVPCTTAVRGYPKWHFDALNTSQMPGADPHNREPRECRGHPRCCSHLVRETCDWRWEDTGGRETDSRCHGAMNATFAEISLHLSERITGKVPAQNERELFQILKQYMHKCHILKVTWTALVPGWKIRQTLTSKGRLF